MFDPRYTTRPPAESAPAADNAWFAPKRFGLGTGLPLRWQGWALLGGYMVVLVIVKRMHDSGQGGIRALAFALLVASTAMLLSIAAKHTRGGWKWRWGGRD